MEAVAAGDHVAAQLLLGAVVAEADAGRVGLDARDGDVLDLVEQRAAGGEAGVGQVGDDLLLPIDGDRRATGELGQVDAVADAVEAQLEALVHEPLALEPLAQPGGLEQVDRALLEHAGAHALLDVVAAARLEHDRLDAVAGEQVAEEQAGRPAADDADLGAHHAAAATACATLRSRTALTPGTASNAVMAMSTTTGTVQLPERSCAAPTRNGPTEAMR